MQQHIIQPVDRLCISGDASHAVQLGGGLVAEKQRGQRRNRHLDAVFARFVGHGATPGMEADSQRALVPRK